MTNQTYHTPPITHISAIYPIFTCDGFLILHDSAIIILEERVMKIIWKMINSLYVKCETKNLLFLALSTVGCALLGAAVWLLAGSWFLPDKVWFICFSGYSAVFIGYIGGILYLFGHDY